MRMLLSKYEGVTSCKLSLGRSSRFSTHRSAAREFIRGAQMHLVRMKVAQQEIVHMYAGAFEITLTMQSTPQSSMQWFVSNFAGLRGHRSTGHGGVG